MRSFTYSTKTIEDLALTLFLHTANAPDDATWELAMKETEAQLQAKRQKLSYIVITDGGAPSTTQRKRLAEATREARYPIAVVNTNPVVRGVITAISWMNPAIKAFAPQKWKEVVAYAGCAEAMAQPLLDEMRRMQKELGVKIACLDAITL